VAGLFVGSALANPRASQYDSPSSKEPTTVVKSKKPATAPKQGTLGVTSSATKPAAAKAPLQVSGGTLPFTGMDLALVIGLGGALAAGGLALRAVGRRRDETS